MNKNEEAQQELFAAVSFSTTGIPGLTTPFAIKEAYDIGADLNAFNEDGRTPMTEAILGGMGSSKAVENLLELGADPNKKDAKGWTPWTACLALQRNPVTEMEQKKILDLLANVNATRDSEALVYLDRYCSNNDIKKVEKLLEQGVSPNPGFLCSLTSAVIGGNVEVAKLLLEHGANVEGNNDEELTPLMHAAQNGNMTLVKLLVEAGANVDHELPETDITAVFYAEQKGYEEIADWLDSKSKRNRKRKSKSNKDHGKFNIVAEKGTNGANYDIGNDDVLKKLKSWDEQYGIEISEVDFNRLVVKFNKLPDILTPLVKEIYEFCPDVIDQGFGEVDGILEFLDETGQELDEATAELIDGVDFEDEGFGEVLLKKSLRATYTVSLWWD